MKRIGIYLFIGLAGGLLLLVFLRGPGRDFAENIFADDPQSSDETPATFSADQDRDGLSDAKEHIFGTDPEKFDTDGDGFSDGEEIVDGFDPTLGGNARIEDSETLMANLTVRYFLWAREVADVEDPQLSDEAVQQFLEAQGLTTGTIPSIPDGDVKRGEDDSDAAVLAYVDALAQVELPETTGSFLDLADVVIQQEQSDVLDEVISGLDETYNAMSAITVPPKLADLHREQLGLLKALRNMFLDLYSIEHDPVLLIRDINWANDLLLRSVEIERQRLDITAPIVSAAQEAEEPAPEAAE